MTTPQSDLERECRIFATYLVGCPPTPYVIAKYADAHQVGTAYRNGSRFDRLLVRAAGTNRLATKLADSYASVLAPTSLLRRKLILLLAVLETSAPSCDLLDAVQASRARLIGRLSIRVIGSALSLLIAALVLLPAHLALSAADRSGR
ncbi:MAG TPA: hypothetical protein VFZ69_15910 [Longimicrobiales bacterium]